MPRLTVETPRAARAIAVARQIDDYPTVIAELSVIFGDDWTCQTFSGAIDLVATTRAAALDLVVIILDEADIDELETIRWVIDGARRIGVKTLIVAETLSPAILHQFLRAGADDFVPYPLPDRALREAVGRLSENDLPARTDASAGKSGRILAVQSLAGGAGGSTFAVNLAWELAILAQAQGKTVCLLDLDLQTGSVATYLDLPRTERVEELLSQTSNMDESSFLMALQTVGKRLPVLTAPADMLPLDLLTPAEIERTLHLARSQFDIVIVDMPGVFIHWTETVLQLSDMYFAMLELDLRSAQNALRAIRALEGDGIGSAKLRFILNRVPRLTDIAGRMRARRMAESLGIRFSLSLPDGGMQIRGANDHGLPLADYAPKNPVRREIQKFATTLLDRTGQPALAAE